MTGIYIRIKTSEGSYENKELDQLSDDELEMFIVEMQSANDAAWLWVRTLAKWIRDNVKEQ